jgi:choline kinase
MPSTRVAVILAAGVGSRLRPLTDDRPKALVDVSGRSILARAIHALEVNGVEKLVIASGYREDALRQAVSRSRLDVSFTPNPRYESTQNSVSLALCRNAIGGESFYRLDGDVVFDPRILARLDAIDAPLVAAVDRGRRLDAEAMKVKAEESGVISAFGKEISLADAAGESIGIELIRASFVTPLFDALDAAGERGETHLYYEDVYSRLIAGGHRARLSDVSDLRWCEIDSPEDLESASRLFSE